MDEELLRTIWREADTLRHRGWRPDIQTLVDIARTKTQITPRVINDLALSHPVERIFAAPDVLIDFVAELARSQGPARVLDPCVTTPALLAAAVESSKGSLGRGFVQFEPMYRVLSDLAKSVSWQQGDLVTSFRSGADETYDMIVSAPPLGTAAPVPLTKDEPAYFKREFGDLLLSRSLPMLADDGIAAVVVSDGFFVRLDRIKFREQLATRGFYLTAAVEISRSPRDQTSVRTSLAIFSRAKSSDLFVGRLSDHDQIKPLLANMLARNPGDADDLGLLVPHDEYPGWEAWALRREIANELDPAAVRILGSGANVRRRLLKAGESLPEAENTVYIPAVGFGEVATTPPEYEGRGRYEVNEVKLDPSQARADYVARWLSTPLGQRVRRAVATGAFQPHVRARDLEILRLLLPSLAEQSRVVSTAQRLATVTATVTRLQSDLWRTPREADRIDAQLERATVLDPIKGWCEALPYPLASVLHRYVADASGERKVDRLLHFFELASEFGAAVLLSAFRRSPTLFAAERVRLAEAASPPGRAPFDRLDFGVWLTLGRTLAKAVRRISDDPDAQVLWADAVGPAADLIERLSDKDYWATADAAREVRNRRAHGGVPGGAQVEQWLDALQANLIELLTILDGCFDTTELVQADAARLQAGVRTYERARKLVGSNDIFEEISFRSVEELEGDSLVFIDRHRDPVRVLPLVPVLRLDRPHSQSRNACYFLSSRQAQGTYAYVSYHSEDEPTIEVSEPAMESLTRDLLIPTEG